MSRTYPLGMACRWGIATAGLVVRAAVAMSLASNPVRTVAASSTVFWRARGSSSRLFFGPPPTKIGNAAGTGQTNSRRGACSTQATPTGAPAAKAAMAAKSPMGGGGGDSSSLPRMAPPSHDFVRHAHSARAGPLWSSVAAFLGWTEERARDLIEFGGVYYKPGSAPASAKPKREIDPERQVEVGEYFRIFPVPKRYPACTDVDWESKIMYESRGVMLVDKPAGVPAHATVDNFVENMLAGLREVRPGLELYLPHRLDIDTSGLVIVVKDSETLGSINDLIRAPGLSLQTGAHSERARKARDRAARRSRKAKNKELRQQAETPLLTEDGDGRVSLETEAAVGEESSSSDSSCVSSSGGGGGRGDGGGAIHKRYRALVEVLPGKSPLKASDTPLTHFQRVSRRAPKEFRRDRPQPNAGSTRNSEEINSDGGGSCTEEEPWIECRLRVLSATEVRLSPSGASQGFPPTTTAGGGGVGKGGGEQAGVFETGRSAEESPRRLQEVEVELLTGRTHQIRGQLAAEGCPIYGDLLYGPTVGRRTATSATTTALSTSITATAMIQGAKPTRAPAASAASAAAAAAGPVGGRFVLRRVEPSLSPPASREGETGRRVESGRLGSHLGGMARQLQSGFVDSPKMALQACHISLEFEGEGGEAERHSYTLGRETCWWASL